MADPPKRGRGRPPGSKNKLKTTQSNQSAILNAPKRGRGRPKKVPEAEAQLHTDGDSDLEYEPPTKKLYRRAEVLFSDEESQVGDDSHNMPKRGRGPPKKLPEAEAQLHLDGDSDFEHEPPTKQLNRRAVMSLISDEDSQVGDESNDVPKRGRGLPKKVPTTQLHTYKNRNLEHELFKKHLVRRVILSLFSDEESQVGDDSHRELVDVEDDDDLPAPHRGLKHRRGLSYNQSPQSHRPQPHLIRETVPTGRDLMPEEELYLNTPRHMVKIGKAISAWKVLNERPDLPGPASYRVPDEERPRVQFSEYWTEADEKILWEQWLLEDELSITNGINTAEQSVWRKATLLYGIPAAAIMVAPLFVSRTGMGATSVRWKYQNREYSSYLEPQNWNQSFSSRFAKLLCCPAFTQNLNFLRYVLQYVLSLRVGQTNVPLPDLPVYDIPLLLNQDRASEGLDPVDVTDEMREGLKSVARKISYYPHMNFIDELKDYIVPDEQPTVLGLSVADIKNIIDVWDKRYIIRPAIFGALQDMSWYQHAFEQSGHSTRGPRGDRVQDNPCHVKRNWVQECRRNVAMKINKEDRLPASSHHDSDPGLENDLNLYDYTPPKRQPPTSAKPQEEPTIPLDFPDEEESVGFQFLEDLPPPSLPTIEDDEEMVIRLSIDEEYEEPQPLMIVSNATA